MDTILTRDFTRIERTEEGESYTIIYHEIKLEPRKVIPHFPASIRNPNRACQELYFHRVDSQNNPIETIATNLDYAFKRINDEERTGFVFECKERFTGLLITSTDMEITHTPQWFMSCDSVHDNSHAQIFGEGLNSRATCWKLPPKPTWKDKVITAVTGHIDNAFGHMSQAGSSSWETVEIPATERRGSILSHFCLDYRLSWTPPN